MAVRGAEALERVDTHDRIDALRLERQYMRLRPHGRHPVGDPRFGEDHRHVLGRYPPVGESVLTSPFTPAPHPLPIWHHRWTT